MYSRERLEAEAQNSIVDDLDTHLGEVKRMFQGGAWDWIETAAQDNLGKFHAAHQVAKAAVLESARQEAEVALRHPHPT